jgi:23S rRNA pseudouridine2604 synthase
VRAIVLTGNGRAFSAGVDLKEAGQKGFSLGVGDKASSEPAADMDLAAAFAACPWPIIGAINGFAITGGFELALMCDVLFASSEAKFADTHSRVGLMPVWGLSQKLPRIIGAARAKELSLTGNYLDAATAERWGLVNRVVAPEELLPAAKKLASEMASVEGGLLKRMKAVIDDGLALPLPEGIADGDRARLEEQLRRDARGRRSLAQDRDGTWAGAEGLSWTRIYDGPEPVRVNKWLAQSGVCSRREAEELIEAGAVMVDGERVTDVGRKIAPGQTLVLNDRAELGLGAQVSVVIHKPVGIVSAQPEHGQTPAARLLTAENLVGGGIVPSSRASLPPLGRLDQDSRGLLLLSEDGVLAKAIIGPDSEIDKEYIVTVSGKVDRLKIQKLRHGLELDGRTAEAGEGHAAGRAGAALRSERRPQPPDQADVRTGGPGGHRPHPRAHRAAAAGRPARGQVAASDRART